mgnify:CR=1 FL=1
MFEVIETTPARLRDVPGIPSESTIWRRLVERGFVTPDPSKAPKRTGRRFNAARANESWQLDDTTWALADGTEVKIFNTIDDHSRLLVTSTAMPTCTGARAFDTLAQAASIIGWPARIQSDNATAFRHVLADALTSILALGALLGGKYLDQVWLDPAMGIVGAILVARWSAGLLRQSSAVLLDHQAPAATGRAWSTSAWRGVAPRRASPPRARSWAPRASWPPSRPWVPALRDRASMLSGVDPARAIVDAERPRKGGRPVTR